MFMYEVPTAVVMSRDYMTLYTIKQNYYNLVLFYYKLKLNSVALVRKQTILTERTPLVGEVRANLCG
jgi:hypothetical protein